MKKLVFLVGLIFSGCCFLGIEDCEEEESIEGCTDFWSFNYNPAATASDGSCITSKGCLGYVSGLKYSGTLGNTLNDPYYDQKMGEEFQIQRQFFSCCPTNLFIIYEESFERRNAYVPNANPNIHFGFHMFYYTISTYGELAAVGVLAHEYGHVLQNYFGWLTGDLYTELEADAFSGFYMALNKQWAWSNIQGYYANTYASGDYNFNSPGHHGTREERLASAQLGVLTAINILQTGIPLSYQELHNHFSHEIRNNIAPRNGKISLMTEVNYPKGLTREYIESLFPFSD